MGPVSAQVVDETGIVEKGAHSAGVARQYCGRVGKKENWQVAASLSVATCFRRILVRVDGGDGQPAGFATGHHTGHRLDTGPPTPVFLRPDHDWNGLRRGGVRGVSRGGRRRACR
jgi:hypothetical protein